MFCEALLWQAILYQHIEAETKLLPFPKWHFQMDFLEWKCMNFYKNFTEVCPKVPVNNIPELVQIMTWCQPGNKPLSEPMLVSLMTYLCITWPQLVKYHFQASSTKQQKCPLKLCMFHLNRKYFYLMKFLIKMIYTSLWCHMGGHCLTNPNI